MSEKIARAFAEIASGMRVQSGYVVCTCGAWNTRDDWHIETFKDNCYMCGKNLFKEVIPEFTGFNDVEQYLDESPSALASHPASSSPSGQRWRFMPLGIEGGLDKPVEDSTSMAIATGKFRKRPVVIEAIEVRAWDADMVAKWCGGTATRNENKHCTGIDVMTLEGTMHANLGDWIIKGVKGEFYPCKPDIFEATYTALPDGGSDQRSPAPSGLPQNFDDLLNKIAPFLEGVENAHLRAIQILTALIGHIGQPQPEKPHPATAGPREEFAKHVPKFNSKTGQVSCRCGASLSFVSSVGPQAKEALIEAVAYQYGSHLFWLAATAGQPEGERAYDIFEKLIADLDRDMKVVNGGEYYGFVTHVIFPRLRRFQRDSLAPSGQSTEDCLTLGQGICLNS